MALNVDPTAAGAGAGVTLPSSMSFDSTLGSLLVGGLAAVALWGVTNVQTFNYFSRGSNDRPSFKLLILALWVLDTFDSALDGHILYFYLVSNYASPMAVMTLVWSIIIHVAITSVCDFIIRSMFARRAFRLSGNWPLTIFIVAVSLTDLICGLVITVKAFKISSFIQLDTLSTLFYINFAAGTISDGSVAIALCYYLHKSRTGFTKTDSLIRVLMLYTVNTGLIVFLDATLGMITYIAMPDNFVFLGFYLLLSKLYLNSYLASLNAREGLRDKVDETPVSIHLSRITNQSNRYDVERSIVASEKRLSNDRVAISVETMVDRKVDGDSSSY
ncbi:hypothetical protein BDN71DRAFT_1505266 [Pleurotus eryngii]|uniref:DUF6534 domain-containing protein n=1 Tax=Pleurotus eryngii TaxID=5323 RepID=A0A9P6DH76_PLEER|nr:hypothetical protein BDN71DRAFT_1505266 [Pleurotus eryngii]